MHRDLVVRVRTGDKAAFAQLYNFYFHKLFGYALRIVKCSELAGDIVHDVFLKVWDNRESLQENLNFKSYVYALTKNHSINTVKQSVNHTRIACQILINIYDKNVKSSEEEFSESEYLDTVLSQLPEQQSRVIKLCKMNGLSYAEAAKELNISPGTVSVHLVKAMKHLRAVLNVRIN